MTLPRLPAVERRAQLLVVAKEVFAQSSYHETSMSEIAIAAGVTKPVLYQHFESKRHLYQALLADVGERLQSAIFDHVAQATTPRQQVEAGFAAYVRFVEQDYDGFSLLFNSTSRQDSEWSKIVDAVERSIASQIAGLLTVMDISEHHALALAHGVVGQAEGMVRYWRSNAKELKADDLLTDLTTLAWAGLRGFSPD